MTTKERLKEFVFKIGYGQNAFEKFIGIANGYLASKSTSITSDTIEKVLAKFPDLDLNWLFTGEGEMMIEDDFDIIERLKKIIYKKGISNEIFCKTLGISLIQWEKIYSHQINIEPNILNMLAEKFPDFSMNWIMTGNGYMNKEDDEKYKERNTIIDEIMQNINPNKFMLICDDIAEEIKSNIEIDKVSLSFLLYNGYDDMVDILAEESKKVVVDYREKYFTLLEEQNQLLKEKLGDKKIVGMDVEGVGFADAK